MKTVFYVVLTACVLAIAAISIANLIPVLASVQEREQNKPTMAKMSVTIDSLQHVTDSLSHKLDIANAENVQMRQRLSDLNDGKKWQQTQISKLTETLQEQNKKLQAKEKFAND